MDEEAAQDPPAEGEAGAEAEAEPATDGADKGEEAGADGEAGEGDEEAEEEQDPADMEIGERIAKDPIELKFLVPLPEKIDFEAIPRINDARSVWRLGMRKIEECFAEHIANMHLDFEDKAKEMERIQT